MNQLRPRFLVRTGDQFTEGAIDRDEYFVPFVEAQTPDEHVKGPARDSSPNLADEFIETIGGFFANTIENEILHCR